MMSSTELAVVNDLKQAIKDEKAKVDFLVSPEKVFEELCRVSTAYVAAQKGQGGRRRNGEDEDAGAGNDSALLGVANDTTQAINGLPIPPEMMKGKRLSLSRYR